jgi:hypothetical protein
MVCEGCVAIFARCCTAAFKGDRAFEPHEESAGAFGGHSVGYQFLTGER